ncbi:hypothetical protein DQ04_04001040 [Trypanosoma grayi]|uniref:hypothetical protein n=1 Tax=Trypanosoma grayi TaxID=71804 RepID=UPI0004F4787C|nr:hypothetical protein DQ04_04001040 [Trypanosoma grayi]KEG10239.1 hypothetical protein DQ04_04001040 [Trypanosoma grayi]
MTGEIAASALVGPTYVLAGSGRLFPNRGFTSGAIVRKRFAENTTTLALTVGFVMPTMMKIHQQLDGYLEEGLDMQLGDVVDVMVAAGKEHLLQFADLLARVAVQTGVSCALIRSRTAYGDSVVYLWDVYPQLHQNYVGALLRFLRLPPFLSTLLGPRVSPDDLSVFEMSITPLAAMEDCSKRNALHLVSDVVVDTVGFCVEWKVSAKSDKKPTALAVRVVMHVTVALMKVGGATAGRAAAGARGEYWGELAGAAAAPLVFGQLSALLLSRSRRRRVSAGVSGRTRSSSKESSRSRGSTLHPSTGRKA